MEDNYKKGLVTIGFPTFNRPDLLEKAFDIILKQTYTNLEIIISDNASTDPKVKQICEEYVKKDNRIQYYRRDFNTGVLENADFVLKKGRGEYFMWFSDDDWRSPEFIEMLVSELDKNPDIDLAFCDYKEVNPDGSFALGYPKSHLGVFKPYTFKSRLLRRMIYFFQYSPSGKGNLFYSLFRKKALDLLSLEKISGKFTYLNMDNLVVFSMLSYSPAVIRTEKMCMLTCGNTKHYLLDQEKFDIIKKTASFIKKSIFDIFLYFRNSEGILEKIIICLGFLPKVIYVFIAAVLKKTQVFYQYKAAKSKDIRINYNKNFKLRLPRVTLVALATENVEEALKALIYSCRGIQFGKVKLISHYTPYGMSKDIEHCRIKKCRDIDDWSRKIIYELDNYIDTDLVLLIHPDGFVVNPDSWRDEFLEYDYIGAPWPIPRDKFSYRDINGNLVRVGNSVSLRSKRLLALPRKLNMPWQADHGFLHEDGFICVKNRHIFEANGVKFAPLEIARFFSHETMIPEIKNIKPFVFHKWAGSNRLYPKFGKL